MTEESDREKQDSHKTEFGLFPELFFLWESSASLGCLFGVERETHVQFPWPSWPLKGLGGHLCGAFLPLTGRLAGPPVQDLRENNGV